MARTKAKAISLNAHENTSANGLHLEILRIYSQSVNQTTIMNKNFRFNKKGTIPEKIVNSIFQ